MCCLVQFLVQIIAATTCCSCQQWGVSFGKGSVVLLTFLSFLRLLTWGNCRQCPRLNELIYRGLGDPDRCPFGLAGHFYSRQETIAQETPDIVARDIEDLSNIPDCQELVLLTWSFAVCFHIEKN